MKILDEFKEFAIKGNVMDMAIGLIIGAAFGKVVTSFVSDILMPPLGMLISGIDFSNLKVTLRASTEATEAVTINYGLFLNALLDFTIVAFAIFIVVKQLNKLKREKEKVESPVKPTDEVKLLTEIRDSLKK